VAFLTIQGVGDASFLLEYSTAPFSDVYGDEMHVLLNYPDSECGMALSMLEDGIWRTRPLHEHCGMSAVVEQVLELLDPTPYDLHMRVLDAARITAPGVNHDTIRN
jgi:hypothetical protein